MTQSEPVIPAKQQFTLTETMIVLLIAGMMAVLVIPVVGRIPNRVAIRQAETALESAFSTAARRARATGVTVELTLDLEKKLALLAPLGAPQPAVTAEPDAPPAPPEEVRFKLPKGVAWQWDEENWPLFTFLPNGQAEGPDVNFVLRKKTFVILLDNLTGKMAMAESND